MKIPLKTGTLEIVSDNYDVLQALTGFGSRYNKKRGFVFVSKVLGKHYPVKPSVMAKTHAQLAALVREKLAVTQPTMVIGFAETATSLGYGVYQQLNLPQAFYIHTTRYRLNQPVWLHFEEEHCHAPTHFLYEVAEERLRALRDQAVTVVLVDDEFSTGRTLTNLVAQLRKKLPTVQNFIAASLLNWMPRLPEQMTCVSLYQGQFCFAAQPTVIPPPHSPAKQTLQTLDAVIPHNFGRRGIQTLSIEYQNNFEMEAFRGKKVLVLGTGEFMYPAFLVGHSLETHGAEAYVQATTRSPLNVDQDIWSKLTFMDNYYENSENFLYNLRHYDHIIICYETLTLPANHQLEALLHPYASEITAFFWGKRF